LPPKVWLSPTYRLAPMTFPSVRYAALLQDDPEDNSLQPPEQEGSGLEFGVPEGTFDSAFTYANYNDLDRMGYEAPPRFGNTSTHGSRYSGFTYTKVFDDEEKEVGPMNIVEIVIYVISVVVLLFTLPFSLLFAMKFVSTSEKLVVLRLGRAQKTRGPGATIIVPCIDTTYKISTTITAFNVPPLQIITIDRGLVELGATVFLRIRDPVSAVCAIQDRNTSTRTLANTMLYRYISKRRICEITNGHERRILAATLKDELGSFTATYGVEITDVEISDVKILKEGENMGLAALSSVVKSDAGAKLWEVIAPHVEEFARSVKSQASTDKPGEPMDPGGPSSESNVTNETLIDIEQSNDDSPEIDEDRLITVINMAIDEQLTKAIGSVFQISCPDAQPIVIDLKHPPGSCTRGSPVPNPDVIFEMSRAVFSKIITQQLSPVTAYMQGSMKVYGSLQDAISFRYLAERVKHLL
ncbi:hypothetical protein V3C99_002893, partial [Haemonchus contortus]|uniref:PHB domain-containing protein n=1 Tax=Haemonchus contortus TaxID=6289 RepID=A0A7I5E8F2_HAECO